MGLTFDRFWGAAMASSRFISGESSVASSAAPAVLASNAAAADSIPAPRPVWVAWPARLSNAVWDAACAFVRGMQASRMRQARRYIAEYRNRLPLPEGSIR
jgi:hypothetical protein